MSDQGDYMAYRKFDISVKKKIAESKNLNLLPEFKIPRTTAQDWISESKEIAASSNQFTGFDVSLRFPVYLTKEKVIVKTSYTEFVFNQDVDDKVGDSLCCRKITI